MKSAPGSSPGTIHLRTDIHRQHYFPESSLKKTLTVLRDSILAACLPGTILPCWISKLRTLLSGQNCRCQWKMSGIRIWPDMRWFMLIFLSYQCFYYGKKPVRKRVRAVSLSAIPSRFPASCPTETSDWMTPAVLYSYTISGKYHDVV